MIPITFYNFAKKPNSTLQPNVNGTTAQCELIEDTSIINPKIRWHEPANASVNVYDFNYCYIAAFGRYYFVTDIKYELGTWVVSLAVDVLATARDIIGPSTQYILRSSYEFDGDVVDTEYPLTTDIIEITKTAEIDPETLGGPDTLYGPNPKPCYVVGLIGAVDPANIPVTVDATKILYNGTVCYYVCTLEQLRMLVDALLSSTDFLLTYNISTSEISEALQKQLINPIQYIHSIKAMPCTPDNVLSTTQTGFMMGFNSFVLKYSDWQQTPYMGTWKIIANKNAGESYLPIPSDGAYGYLHTHRCTVRAPLHPQYYTDRAGCHYIVGDPYSKYTVYVEPFGLIDLQPGNMLASKIDYYEDPEDPGAGYYYIELKFDCTVDYSSGDARLKIWSTPAGQQGEVIHFIGTSHVAVDVPFHQATQDVETWRASVRSMENTLMSAPAQIAAGAFSFMAGAKSNNPMAQVMGIRSGANTQSETINAIESGKSAIDSAERAAQVGITAGGSAAGSWMKFCRDLSSPVVHAVFYELVPELRNDIGRPLCKPRQVSNVPGYLLCLNGHIQSRLTATENQMIEDYMNGGFYYE